MRWMIVAAAVVLSACKLNAEATIYVSDVIAVANGETEI